MSVKLNSLHLVDNQTYLLVVSCFLLNMTIAKEKQPTNHSVLIVPIGKRYILQCILFIRCFVCLNLYYN